jgi:VIT1/CCC1 family predicted Fe2+/Mn2+ transporter
MIHTYNPKYIHHQKSGIASSIREIVFGMEDGMVSTMGAVTGIAVGSGDHFIVILSSVVIIAVESISMGVGSYLSSKSEREVGERMLEEERQEIKAYPVEEKEEMVDLFKKDGWPKHVAVQMAEYAAKDKKLMLKEMAYRELRVIPGNLGNPIRNGFFMWGSYIFGGLIPVFPYFLINDSVVSIVPVSVFITLFGLFFLGVATTKFSNRVWWKAGLEMFVLAGLAGLVGYLVGFGVEKFFLVG